MQTAHLSSSNRNFVKENNELTSYLQSLAQGRQGTPHSWLYEHKDADTVLQQWQEMLHASLDRHPLGDVFLQFDEAQLPKFGQQGKVPSISSPEAQEVLAPLYSPTEYDDEEALASEFLHTEAFAKELFGPQLMTKRPLALSTVVDNMRERDTLSTNSGFPRFTRRSLVHTEEVEDATTGKAYDYPAIILFRQYNGKLRPVWMFPMSLNLLEFRFSQAIQTALLLSPSTWVTQYLSPWKGYEDVKRTLTIQWSHPAPLVGGDTTKMDANMRPAQIRLVYEIVKWLFQKDYWPELYRSLLHVTTIELLHSEDQCYTGTHGLASGSGWTQLTETVLQMFMAWRANSNVGQGIGDDFYWIGSWTADSIVDYLGKFGLPANPSKQTVSSTELTFLQRLNLQDFFSREDDTVLGAYYPTIRALNSLIWPERFHNPKFWSVEMFAIRNYMILENCVDDPCFEEFVSFVVHGHSEMIPFAKLTGKQQHAYLLQSRLVPGLNPSYNQEKREKPLSSFKSIQLAKRM